MGSAPPKEQTGPHTLGDEGNVIITPKSYCKKAAQHQEEALHLALQTMLNDDNYSSWMKQDLRPTLGHVEK